MKELLNEISTSYKEIQQEPFANWHRRRIEIFNKASVINQFLFCPIKTSYSQPRLPKLSEKAFAKHVPFMIDFNNKLKVSTSNQVQLHQKSDASSVSNFFKLKNLPQSSSDSKVVKYLFCDENENVDIWYWYNITEIGRSTTKLDIKWK